MFHHNFFLYFRLIWPIFFNNIIQLLSQKKGKKKRKKEKEKQIYDSKYENKHAKYINLFMWLCPQQHSFLFYLNRLPKVDLLCRLYKLEITHNIKRPHKNPKPKIQFALNFGREIMWDINLTKATFKPLTQKLIIHIPDPIKFPIMG